MKVLMIGSHLRTTGGITRVIKNYLEAGLDQKVELTFLPSYYGGNHFINIVYYILQYLKLKSKLLFNKKKFDVAHIHMSYKGSFIRKKYIIKLLNKNDIPIILHMHGSEFKDYYNNSTLRNKGIIIETLNNVSTIIALGNEWKEFYESISSSKVESLDNAVFPKSTDCNSQDKTFITSMGVLSKRKGTYDLIQAGIKLKGLIDNKYKIVLAGDGETEKVEKEIKELGLEDLFVIPGWVSDPKEIEELYRKSIVYVLPSYNEGMPMSILEAMSYGLPVISTNVGSIESVVGENNGFIISPGDIDKLVEKILMIISDENLRKVMSNNNRVKISNNYNIDLSLDKLIAIYKNSI